MTSREDFGRLAYAAYCDMTGRPFAWAVLTPREQAGWTHAATTVRDRLALGITHAYRPDDREESDMQNKTTLHGGNEEPTINATDDRALYERLRAEGRDDVEWTGDGPAPGEEQRQADEAAAQAREQQDKAATPAKRTGRTSRTTNDVG